MPDSSNEMYGRGGFLIHGDLADAAKRQHRASLGCIIVPRLIRWAIWGCDDVELEVVRE